MKQRTKSADQTNITNQTVWTIGALAFCPFPLTQGLLKGSFHPKLNIFQLYVNCSVHFYSKMRVQNTSTSTHCLGHHVCPFDKRDSIPLREKEHFSFKMLLTARAVAVAVDASDRVALKYNSYSCTIMDMYQRRNYLHFRVNLIDKKQ